MKISKVILEDIFSYGNEVIIADLKYFNLFIGGNGTGKTNTLKLLGELEYEVEGASCESNGDGEPINFDKPVFLVRLPYHYQNYNLYEARDRTKLHSSKLVIEIDDEKLQDIVFEDGLLCKGSPDEYKKQISIISGQKSFLELEREMRRREQFSYWNAILNFGLTYIFETQINFEKTGSWALSNNKNPENPDHPMFNNMSGQKDQLSSGQEYCAKTIIEILFSSNSVVLLDEPDKHLEPRRTRRFIYFLVWLNMLNSDDIESESSTASIINKVSEHWKKWKKYNARYLKDSKNKEVVSEEIALPYKPRQFIIASHSNVLINEFLSLDDIASVYEFSSPYQMNSYSHEGESKGGEGKSDAKKIKRITAFTEVRKVNANPINLLQSLGCKGADLLQTNGVIWVEGPSDVIFIKRWIEMYCIQNRIHKFEQGLHYEFKMFGGTLLDSLCLTKKNIEAASDNMKKLVEMFSFSRNAYVVIDSDAVIKDGKIYDKSNFEAAKLFIENEVQELEKNGYLVGLWFQKGDDTVTTIEGYIDSDTLDSKKASETKKLFAQRVTKQWDNNFRLSNFPHDLEERIKNLVEMIVKWNEV